MHEDGDAREKLAESEVVEPAYPEASSRVVTCQPSALGPASDPPRTSPFTFLHQPGLAAARELLQRCRAGRPLLRLRSALFCLLLVCCALAGLLRGAPSWTPPPLLAEESLPITARKSGALLAPPPARRPPPPVRARLAMGFVGDTG